MTKQNLHRETTAFVFLSKRFLSFVSAIGVGAFLFTGPVLAEPPPAPPTSLIRPALIEEIRQWASTPVVQITLAAMNAEQQGLDLGGIDALDKQWRAETKSDDQPMIGGVLSNPLSMYLLRIQAGSVGKYTELFIFSAKGLNAGQSSVTSDYWQGDEAKFQKTYDVASDAVFVDAPEYHEGTGTWRAQVSMTLVDGTGAKVGAVTAEINLTELARRAAQNVAG